MRRFLSLKFERVNEILEERSGLSLGGHGEEEESLVTG
jgi:hypothetical protein